MHDDLMENKRNVSEIWRRSETHSGEEMADSMHFMLISLFACTSKTRMGLFKHRKTAA